MLESGSMFSAAIPRSLLLLMLLPVLAAPVIAQGAGDAPTGAPAATSEILAIDLGRRLDLLQSQLDAVRDARGEPLRQAAMERHWKGMQDYMAASLKVPLRDPAAADKGSAADCRVVGSGWTGLSFPGQLRSDDYLKAMQSHMGRMREGLIDLHASHDPDALGAALQAHWRSNYEFLQTLRGLGWMFPGWTPAAPGDSTLPDPQSEGAKLTQTYCSMCHAIPPVRLHTEAEWAAVMSTMSQHIASSDGGFPMCVQLPSAGELGVIGTYLAKYAR
jgi:hypothetical protein